MTKLASPNAGSGFSKTLFFGGGDGYGGEGGLELARWAKGEASGSSKEEEDEDGEGVENGERRFVPRVEGVMGSRWVSSFVLRFLFVGGEVSRVPSSPAEESFRSRL